VIVGRSKDSQVLVLPHQQQQMMAQLAKTGGTSGSSFRTTPKLPDGVFLPLDTIEQLTSQEHKLRSEEVTRRQADAGEIQL